LKRIALTAFVLLMGALQLHSQAIIDSIAGPGPGITGLAWDGAYLWVSSTRRDSVFQISPETGAVVSGFGFEIEDDYGGLAWGEDASLWIANRDSIYQLDPETGEVLAGFLAPGC
jgi:streptogramin lyase